MKKFIINGGKPLKGEVLVSGAKNSTVALIPAAIMGNSPVSLDGVPDIADVKALIEILEDFNCDVSFENNHLVIDPEHMVNIPMPEGKIQSLRASYYFMGALLAKYGEGVVGLPGGCSIGPRPIDLHIKGFEALGAVIENQQGAIHFSTPNGLHGAEIYMDVVSVGATINVMLAATMAEGKTTIENAAREPEIIDVVSLLNKMGAKIKGAGTSTIRIEGVDELTGTNHQIIPDRIEAGTYLTAAAAVGQGVTVKNVIFEHIEGFVAKMGEMGVQMDIYEDEIYVHPAQDDLNMVSTKTMPYPGFATDLQQPITPLLLKAQGEGTIEDTIYPKRIKHIPELVRMGAQAKVINDQIHLTGPSALRGAEVTASDLRAGACLINAALMAEGRTELYGAEHILRGYDKIADKLQQLGADIELVED
ncbi:MULTISPECIES: UDP-N-acetylglucosamine 1-carboxyvinyltransferase [Aerococcus]|uniref:UDP-N-acetylglucosamine 1-carboxyvinyltransferase n=1 Tax=Aerococcus sanguinicola TaxID=119206 RepID=A0A5N1GPG4_9LACT|nr:MULTISPECIES: UDP-N-acetylglucosamine 1-carboxyvinyltransferase [Aerococcus]KAA9300600.1 UDP-N-acetylglucosamine 1-carboxyvinyltransferase [Aerococcus sanguinicola]MDK6369598.1 UDP-N-acetylglucosamine 1-carboxyvinyltransferase [Aerococcus sp. UMB9870]MDK6680103.1 UDP-N-acetylglucosamine 1-carboxyvinyltransferase [Aerococcus sp. UMB8608]MDK6686264.1 UDP-N-acetylglucosamine 1-carboxyvinyltransferase [Aerococcus sp. UMB8623]MDK6940183.1 UDP-N-acetylglucosamine 1-carboxyvinyltransferase [Aeroco